MQSQSKQRKIRDFKLNGYDRPSKAIDWLMKEVKPAIDALEDDHRDHDLLTTVLDTSKAFRGTDREPNEHISTHAQISPCNMIKKWIVEQPSIAISIATALSGGRPSLLAADAAGPRRRCLPRQDQELSKYPILSLPTSV
ncbi:hypothetical protein L2E82_15358 [Cichorium intybus]|uniref:Uncharacterized protein n=1 Tax=Cichorium intybus TaxID=13427 RepID=A0ACB9F357_CICIN|nr:hypothetical protein L2E82_15358 [Cichorium intybus]